MANRIFPADKNNEEFGSDKSFAGIDWGKVNLNIDNIRKNATAAFDSVEPRANDKDEVEKEEASFIEADDEGNKEVDAGGMCPGKPARRRKRRAPKEKNEEFFKNKKRTATESGPRTANSLRPDIQQKRVIAFTHTDQLSPEAIEAAKAEGDDELVHTILAARHQRRLAIAVSIERQMTEAIEEAEGEYRYAEVDSASAKFDEAGAEHAVEDGAGFKSVSELSSKEQDTFRKMAMEQGFPVAYVEHMLSGGDEPSEDVRQIIELFSAEDISKEAKTKAARGMIKTAKLTDRDLSHLKNYWIQQLGYDKEWVEDLFTNKYYSGGEHNNE